MVCPFGVKAAAQSGRLDQRLLSALVPPSASWGSTVQKNNTHLAPSIPADEFKILKGYWYRPDTPAGQKTNQPDT